MVTPTFDISESSGVRSIGPARTDGECLRYRLDVIAASAADAVNAAGGWLYDRAMAGWEVAVLLPPGCDSRPLRILGVKAMDLEAGFDRTGSATHKTHSLAVSAKVFAADDRIRETVLKALNHGLTEVALWGEGWPLAVNRGMGWVQHVLSSAARTFKGHALAAAGIYCGTVDPTEAMLYDMAACSPADLDRVWLG
jgi:hypothetical protein